MSLVGCDPTKSEPIDKPPGRLQPVDERKVYLPHQFSSLFGRSRTIRHFDLQFVEVGKLCRSNRLAAVLRFSLLRAAVENQRGGERGQMKLWRREAESQHFIRHALRPLA